MPAQLQLVPRITDAEARLRALDITRSFIVEAPAGSGKTALLIQRFLKLLAADSVTDPAQVLAITFTRKATSEMRDRVLAQLASAAAGEPIRNDFEHDLRTLAEAVLARDRQLGWNLLDRPARLNIRTIDSLSGEIASALPILSGSGGNYAPTEDASTLHAEAARRTLMLLGGDDPALNHAIETLLLHRDGSLDNCESLIAAMLARRDQWGALVPLSSTELSDAHLDKVILPRLDRALDLAVCRALTRLTQLLPHRILDHLCALAAEMASLDGYKGNPSPIALCAGKLTPPADKAAHLDHWRALIHLLLTKDGDFRRGFNTNHIGFMILKHHKTELTTIIQALDAIPGVADALCDIETLPPAEYPREDWPIAKALFRVLSRALAELQLVFAERGNCDFTELGLLARHALRTDSALDDLSTLSGTRLQHLLVDEMQDTSSAQYEFLQLLTRRWDGHSQTVFLVGDPKQSIYLFRQARVERFLETLASNLLGDLPLTTLRLTANFRSTPTLVRAFNDDFTAIFPARAAGPESVSYTPVAATRDSASGDRIWHTATIPSGPTPEDQRLAIRTQSAEHAQQVRDLIQTWRAKPLLEGRTQPWKIAVLVRNRAHLIPILAVLKQPTPIPYRAVEIEPLAERPEILDLLALTRALLHPADRTAWLALLRSPLCGLSLADLHRLAGTPSYPPDKTLTQSTLITLLNDRGAELSADGIARLEPFYQTITSALALQGRLSLSAWVHHTWRAFRVPDFLTAEALTNAERFFALLDAAAAESPTLDLSRLQQKLEKLYAAPAVTPDAVDLMTLHKAKGLEWDFVIVPDLHRKSGSNPNSLLSWLETAPDDAEDDIAPGILAPISPRGRSSSQLTGWIRRVENSREAAERKRLFYVACTRAREELHLFAAPKLRKSGEVSRESGTLLEAAWPAAEPHFHPPTTRAQLTNIHLLVLPEPATADLAAASEPAPARFIERIPHHYPGAPSQSVSSIEVGSHIPFHRPEGSFAARALGNTLHAFLELLAEKLAANTAPTTLLAELPTWRPRIAAVLRAAGLAPADTARLTAEVLRGLTRTLESPEGLWLLHPHPAAASESAVTSWNEETASTLRLDRTFLAGPEPLSHATTHRWILDYKTSTHAESNLEAFLTRQRELYAPQLAAYAREFPATPPIRLALFYPLLGRLIYWSAESDHSDEPDAP